MYTSIAEAVKRHPTVSVMVNFSSFRSVYETTMDALNYSDTIRTLAIIAEGVPESQTREIIKAADEKKVCMVIVMATRYQRTCALTRNIHSTLRFKKIPYRCMQMVRLQFLLLTFSSWGEHMKEPSAKSFSCP